MQIRAARSNRSRPQSCERLVLVSANVKSAKHVWQAWHLFSVISSFESRVDDRCSEFVVATDDKWLLHRDKCATFACVYRSVHCIAMSFVFFILWHYKFITTSLLFAVVHKLNIKFIVMQMLVECAREQHPDPRGGFIRAATVADEVHVWLSTFTEISMVVSVSSWKCSRYNQYHVHFVPNATLYRFP